MPSSTGTTISLNDSTSVPWIAFGTGTALYGQDVADAVKTAVDGGFTHLDGAQIYLNEDSLGKGIADSGKPRSELYITTKLTKLQILQARGQNVKEALQESLKKIGTDYVDLFLVHVPSHGDRLKEVWKAMEGVKKDGLAKSVGVSNFKERHLKEILEIATIKPAVNQIEFHPYVYQSSEALYKFCQQEGIVIASYAGLTPLFRAPDGPLKTILPGIRERLEKSLGKPVTEAQVLMKWVKQKNILIVTTTSKKERIQEYLDVLKVPDLTAEEIKSIDENGLEKRIFNGFWEFEK